jgi:hypothetical protein
VAGYGSARSPTTILLVESFAQAANSGEMRLEMLWAVNGGVVFTPKAPAASRQISDAELLRRFPGWLQYEAAHSAYLRSALERGYILESELGMYAQFMRVLLQLVQFFGVGGWLAFLRLERELRFYQYESGCPWDAHFGMLNPLLISLAAATASKSVTAAVAVPPSAVPLMGVLGVGSAAGQGSGAAGSSAGVGQGGAGGQKVSSSKLRQSMLSSLKRPGICFKWFNSGQCGAGAECPYAAEHVCTLCRSSEHGTKSCPRLPGQGTGGA